MENQKPFHIKDEREGMVSVLCNLPLVYLAGPGAEQIAADLAVSLNKVFARNNPRLAKSIDAAEKLIAERAKRKHSYYMYLAVKAVLRTQRDAGGGPMNWEEIWRHPDFNLPLVCGSVFAQNPLSMKKMRKSIQGAVYSLRAKGTDIESVLIPGKGMCFSLA